ncbi:MAG: Ribonuclease J (endonuclease and 5' exonuclease) [Firmicutes bacterium]|nr:Ribonuclease J (endonuclease and 5' exonuclease) [Bacillota bacterium]
MSTSKKQKIKIIPLGGLHEIGKNMTVIESSDDILVIDCGLTFPEEEMLGIDVVIPDITYLEKNKEKIRAIILTHGHEDHIGALPYVLERLKVPVYGTKLTLGLVKNKLSEFNMEEICPMNIISAGQTEKFGGFEVEFIRTSHSIADSVALAIFTDLGVIVHTSDFKVDFTPIDREIINLHRFAELGQKGVLMLLADSTNVERPGYTMSEKTVGDTFDDIFAGTRNRIIVATFASNVHRIQQIINSAHKFGRKVAVCGRSMVNVVSVASDLGYLDIPEGLLVDIEDIGRYGDHELTILTTGSQGEPMSALTRMANSDHRNVEILPGDLVIISASAIPGNEKLISRVINRLFAKGANVIYEDLADVHVSGHACQEELKLIHSLVRPKFFMPVHGEYRHLERHARLAKSLGMSSNNIIVAEIGNVIELTNDTAKITGNVTAGKVLVDGLGVGDVGNVVLRDRQHLAQDGLMVVVVTISKEVGSIIAGPDIISRGFVYVRESEDLMEQARLVVRDALQRCEEKQITEWATLKSSIRDSLRAFLYEKTKRKPMILPIIMEI